MADTRGIAPAAGRRTLRGSADGYPRVTAAPTGPVYTRQCVIASDRADDPTPILELNENRLAALIYYPATDPITQADNAADHVVWIVGGAGDAFAFPLEPGAQMTITTGDRVYGHMSASETATPRLYVLEEDE